MLKRTSKGYVWSRYAEKVFKDMWVANVHEQEIAGHFNINILTLQNKAAKMGLEKRNKSSCLVRMTGYEYEWTPEQLEKVAKLYVGKCSYLQIAQKFGVSEYTIERLINKIGLPPRDERRKESLSRRKAREAAQAADLTYANHPDTSELRKVNAKIIKIRSNARDILLADNKARKRA